MPADGVVPGHKALGVGLDDVGILQLNPALALVQGAVVTKEMVTQTAVGLGTLLYTAVHGAANLSSVAGPIGIVSIGSTAVRDGIINSIVFAALVSVSLAVFNVLPIPGLDGGRLLFVIIEAVRGKPISEKWTTRVTMAVLALLILLVLLVSYHDITHLVHPA